MRRDRRPTRSLPMQRPRRRGRRPRRRSQRPAGRPAWPIVAWCAVRSRRAVPEPHRPRASPGSSPIAARPSTASADFGHNTELVGWAYAEQTHSWVEPTAFAVLALQGRRARPTIRPRAKGSRVLLDRQLPGGGLNYGNTFVLGQLLRPHVQPTGIALLALAGEADASGRLPKSIAWLRRSIGPETTPLSLGWAVLGLRAHGVELPAGRRVAGCGRGAASSQRDRSPSTSSPCWPWPRKDGPHEHAPARSESAVRQVQPPGLADRRRRGGGAGRRGTRARLAAASRPASSSPRTRRTTATWSRTIRDGLVGVRPRSPSRCAASACCSSRTWSSRRATART